jgi:intraflagellar transport protein 140
MDQAVLLYQRAGQLSKAIEMCFRGDLFTSLKTIVDELVSSGSETDPALLAQCARFFLEKRQFDKAVQLYTMSGNYGEALEICLDNNVTLSEDIVDKMTPPKPQPGPLKVAWAQTVTRLAQACLQQGLFQLACKKFSQAGDRIQAMQCLLKSGDMAKITYYAERVRKADVFILSANYLSSLNSWHTNPETMRTIISFYTKAKAFFELSLFYEGCAMQEIDNFRDYEKALAALNQSRTCLMSARKAPDKEDRLMRLDNRIRLTGKFLEARNLSKMMLQVNSQEYNDTKMELQGLATMLLNEQREQEEIFGRNGDVYGLLAEFYFRHGDEKSSYEVVQQMQERDIKLEFYLGEEILEPLRKKFNLDANIGYDDDEGLGEEIEEGLDEGN